MTEHHLYAILQHVNIAENKRKLTKLFLLGSLFLVGLSSLSTSHSMLDPESMEIDREESEQNTSTSQISSNTHTSTEGTNTDSMDEDKQGFSLLESLPDELLLHIFQQVEDPLRCRSVSKRIHRIVSDPSLTNSKWIVIKDRKSFNDYLTVIFAKEHTIPRIRISYHINDNELSQLVEANPQITHLEIEDCTKLSSAAPFSKLTLQSLDLGICLNTGEEVSKFIETPLLPLTKVRIGHNDFSDEDLKKLIVAYPYLTTLNLSITNITDAGLNDLSQLQNLTALNLYSTKITDISTLQVLPHLTVLDLSYTNITGAGLQALPQSLTTLNLYGANITGVPTLPALPHLIVLDLSHTNITDISSLDELPNLATLNLLGTKITSNSIKSLPQSLTTLNLGWCSNITDDDLQHLSTLQKLTTLDLQACSNITGAGLQALPQSLTILNLYSTKITDISALEAVSHLTVLNLSSTRITDKDLQYLPKGLTALNLGYTGITDISTLQALSHLTILDLNNTKITDNDLQYLPKGLTTLNLWKCGNLRDISVLQNLTNLTKLGLYSPEISYADLQYLPKGLKELNLCCSKVTDNDLQYLPKGLTMLDLHQCVCITDPSSLKDLPNLTILNLGECKGLTDLSALKDLPRLKKLWRPDEVLLEGEELEKYLSSL